LAAAALLIAAAALLAAGLKSALDRPEPAPAETTAFVNPFEAAQVTGPTGGGYTGGSYVVGYTGVTIIAPGEDGTAPPSVAQPPPQANTQQQAPQQYPVNMNTATQAQLETLPGIGPVKAQAILAWRAANGAFSNANRLIEVNGIGQKTLENMLPYITW